MGKKVSFREIISQNSNGSWCNGIALLNVNDGEIEISNIYSKGDSLGIEGYPISKDKKIFSEVIMMDYSEAIKELKESGKSIVSPKLVSEIVTFEGIKAINYGGDVYSYTVEGKIIVNDKHKFKCLDEILSFGFIGDKEKSGKWMVF